LADGSDTIWRLQEKYFAEAEVCLDWYHVVEKLWTAASRITLGQARATEATDAERACIIEALDGVHMLEPPDPPLADRGSLTSYDTVFIRSPAAFSLR
jgi:hypothetical protein